MRGRASGPTVAGMSMSIVSEGPVETLRQRLRGPLLAPGDDGFDEATRLWNGLIDKAPALVVQPTGTADVVEAVRFAREHERPALGARRRTQHRRDRAGGRRPHDRHVAAARDRRGPRGAHRHRAARMPAGGRRPRDAAPRPGHAARLHLRGRHGGPDARRRARLPHTALRLDGRQPARGRDRHGRRPGPARQPRRERRPVLGGARRGRQPRAPSRASCCACTRWARTCTAG